MCDFDSDMKEALEEDNIDLMNEETFGDIADDDDDDWEKEHEKLANELSFTGKNLSDLDLEHGTTNRNRNGLPDKALDDDDDNELERSINQLVVDDEDLEDVSSNSKGRPIPHKRAPADLDHLFGPSSPPGLYHAEDMICGQPNIWGSPAREGLIHMQNEPGGIQSLLKALQQQPRHSNGQVTLAGGENKSLSASLPNARTLDELEQELRNVPQHPGGEPPQAMTLEDLERQIRCQSTPRSYTRKIPSPVPAGLPLPIGTPPRNQYLHQLNKARLAQSAPQASMAASLLRSTPPPSPPPGFFSSSGTGLNCIQRGSPPLMPGQHIGGLKCNSPSPSRVLRTPSPPPIFSLPMRMSPAAMLQSGIVSPLAHGMLTSYLGNQQMGRGSPRTILSRSPAERMSPTAMGQVLTQHNSPHGFARMQLQMQRPIHPNHSRMQQMGPQYPMQQHYHPNGRGNYGMRSAPPRQMHEERDMRYRGPGQHHMHHHYHRSYDHHHDDRSEYDYSRPRDDYANLMTQREKDWVIKIQLMQLQTDNPYLDDFYYTSWLMKKLAEEKRKEKKENGDKDDTEPKLVLPQLSRVETKAYRPVQFEGALGRLSASSVHNPRQILDVRSSDIHETEESRGKDTKKFKELLLDIETGYDVLLDVDDIEKKVLALPEESRQPLFDERREKVTKLYHRLRYQPQKKTDFLQRVSIRKGIRLLTRLLRLMQQSESQDIVCSLFRNLQHISKKDWQENVLVQLHAAMTQVIRNSDLEALVGYTEELAKSESTQNQTNVIITALQNKFGSSVIWTLIARGEKIYATESPVDLDVDHQHAWTDFVLSVGEALDAASKDSIACPPVRSSDVTKHLEKLLNKKIFIAIEDKLQSILAGDVTSAT